MRQIRACLRLAQRLFRVSIFSTCSSIDLPLVVSPESYTHPETKRAGRRSVHGAAAEEGVENVAGETSLNARGDDLAGD